MPYMVARVGRYAPNAWACEASPLQPTSRLGPAEPRKGGTDFTSRPICWTQASTVSMVGVSTSTSRLISWTTVRSASISSGRPFSRSWSTTCAPTPATPLIRRSTSPGNARRPGGRSFGLLHHRRATMRVPGSHDVERRVSAEMGSKQRLPHSQISLRISGRILGERPPA